MSKRTIGITIRPPFAVDTSTKAYSSLSFDRIYFKLAHNLPWVVPPKSICQHFDIVAFGFLVAVFGFFWLNHQKAYSSLSFDQIFFKLSQILPWVVPPKIICQILDILICGFLGNFLGGFWLVYQKAYSSLNFDRIFFKLSQNLSWVVPPKRIGQILDILIWGFWGNFLGRFF